MAALNSPAKGERGSGWKCWWISGSARSNGVSTPTRMTSSRSARLRASVRWGTVLTRTARLRQDQVGQRLEATVAGSARAGLALGAIGQVEVFDGLEHRGGDNGLCKLGGQFALLGDQP